MYQISDGEMMDLILDAIKGMDPTDRVFALIAYLDLFTGQKTNTTQIAKLMGMPQPDFYRRLTKALIKLGQKLNQQPAVRIWIESKTVTSDCDKSVVGRLLQLSKPPSSADLG